VRFSTVKYGRTYNMGNYQSERIDLEADLDDGDDAEAALQVLQEWVAQQSSEPEEAMRSLEQDRKSATRKRQELRELESKLAQARSDWNRLSVVFAKLGLQVPSEVENEIPF
jgi:hypothetical protein